MTLPPETSAACREALAKVVRTAQAAEAARDTESARHALNAVWFAAHAAQHLLNDAEQTTRRAALDQLESRAA